MDSKEGKIFTAILIAAFFLAVILIYFIATLIKHQRKNVQLHLEKVNAEISALEAERKRIASDLHDDFGSFLSSIKLQVNLLNTRDEEDMAAIKDISKQIDGIVEKVRETSNNLMSNILIRKGLIVAIKNFAERINSTKALFINTFFSENIYLNEEKELHIYRIFQECIHNTLKHSNATEFQISLEVKTDGLCLLMSDNGKGFDLETISREGLGFGLKNISSRVDMLNGDLFIDTKPEKGVSYTILIPL